MGLATTDHSATKSPIPSSRRPIPLLGRRDLIAQQTEFQSGAWWVVKDPVGLQYHRLSAYQYKVLGLLDGQRSLKEIRDALSREFPAAPLSLPIVQRMITSLHMQGLVLSQRPGQAAYLIEKQHRAWRQSLFRACSSLLSIRLPCWDPDATLEWLHRRLRWIYSPTAAVLSVLIVVAAWTLLLVQFNEFRSRLPEFRQFFSWQNLIWLWLTLSATKILHEFGHGLTCKHYGGECHGMGVMLLVFSPTLYCDVTDSWLLRNKWHRIAIAAGGMIVEVVISALAIFVWWFTTPGLLNHLSLNVFFVSTISTVIFNANPLLRYDGYYMLSDWLGVPNLRERSTGQLRDAFAETCLGITRPPDSSITPGSRLWFVFFAIASSLYSWSVLCAVLLFVYFVLKPYGLQSLGALVAAMSLCGIVGGTVASLYQIIVAPRSEPMNYLRTALTTVVLGGAVIAGLALPLPWYIEAPFLIEPENVADVMNSGSGQLVSFAVKPGETVQKGDLLAVLRDDAKEDLIESLEVALDAQQAELVMLQALDAPAEVALAKTQLVTLQRRVADLRQQLGELTITAPISGTVIRAHRVPDQAKSVRRRLHEWSGDISNPTNLGCLVQARTHLLSIAPGTGMQALVYLDQAHRDDLTVGQQLEVKFEHLADHTYRAAVADIAREQSDIAPLMLSNKRGGALVSVTDSEGRERLASVAYQARVLLTEDSALLKPGMRGTARFLVDRRSAAQWIWRAVCRTFRFQL